MKICHAYLFFSIKFAGGTSDLMFKICKAQKKAGLMPMVCSGDYKFDHELAKELEGVNFKMSKSWLDRLGFSIMPGLKKTLAKDAYNIDIVHMHVYRTFQNIKLYRFCKRYNIPYVMDAHGSVPLYRKKRMLKRLYDKLIGKKIMRDASMLIAETQVGVDEYKELMPDYPDEKIKILSPPFDTDEYEKLPEKGLFRSRYNIPTDKQVVMFLGRVHHIKGNDFLIKGFAELYKQQKDIVLVIVGPDDGHMADCKALAKELGVQEQVIFTGFLGGEYKNSALVDADIVVQLSRQEQGAWAPLEGVLCETPIIVTSHTGTGEDIKRLDAGYLVDFDDVSGLASQINYILMHHDEAMNKTLRAKRHIIDHLSMNSRVHEYTDIYKACLAK